MASKRDFLLTPEDIQFSENLKVMADVLDFSQKDLSEYFNVNRVTINNYFNQRNHPTVQFLILLERATGVPMIAWVTRRIDKSEFPQKLGKLTERVEEPGAMYGKACRLEDIERRLVRIEEHLQLPKIGNA